MLIVLKPNRDGSLSIAVAFFCFAVVLPYQVLSTITITTALSFDTARRNEGRVLFYPLLVREDLKQR